jgi:hypothetical protein
MEIPAIVRAVALLVLLALCGSAAAQDGRCDALFEQAAAELAAEQYARALRIASDRMRLCADPESAFLVGLAEANMVDGLLVGDPAQREQLRQSALRHLRLAAAGGNLRPVWRFTVHDWIVHLQALGPAVQDGPPEFLQADDEFEEAAADIEPLDVPPAPPPQPQPAFPWGPVITGALGVGALTAGIVLAVSAGDSRDEARSAANQLREVAGELERDELSDAVRRTKALNDEANSKAKWSTIFLVGGAVAAVTSIVWYVALPPKGKWRWAATPAGLQTTVRF